MANYYVYFIAALRPHRKGKGTNTPIKIGYSKDPEGRVAELQTGNPAPLKISALMLCRNKHEAMLLESTLHEIAGKRHTRLAGEWFIIKGSCKSLIEDALLKAKMVADPVLSAEQLAKQAERQQRREASIQRRRTWDASQYLGAELPANC
jgi:hypothetical protein